MPNHGRFKAKRDRLSEFYPAQHDKFGKGQLHKGGWYGERNTAK